MSFWGYQRPDGSAGTRNYVLVIPQGLIAKTICDLVPGAHRRRPRADRAPAHRPGP